MAEITSRTLTLTGPLDRPRVHQAMLVDSGPRPSVRAALTGPVPPRRSSIGSVVNGRVPDPILDARSLPRLTDLPGW